MALILESQGQVKWENEDAMSLYWIRLLILIPEEG